MAKIRAGDVVTITRRYGNGLEGEVYAVRTERRDPYGAPVPAYRMYQVGFDIPLGGGLVLAETLWMTEDEIAPTGRRAVDAT